MSAFVIRHQLSLLVALALAVVTIRFSDSVAVMTDLWRLTSYQHAYLIVPVCAWLLWRDRARLSNQRLVGSAVGLLATFAVVIGWKIASIASIQLIEQICVVLLVSTSTWAIAGDKAARQVAFPLLFLIAAVPMGAFMIPWLMRLTADISGWLLELFGVPFWREGMLIYMPNGTFEVAEVCSGLRYLLASIVAAVLFSYLNFRSAWKGLLFVSATAISFIVLNGIRAFLVIWIASGTNMKYMVGKDHVYFGMVLFLLLAMALFHVGHKYADDSRLQKPEPRTDDLSKPTAKSGFMALATLAIVILAPSASVFSSSKLPATSHFADFPEQQACDRADGWGERWAPAISNPDISRTVTYECEAYRLSAYKAGFAASDSGGELLNITNRMLPEELQKLAEQSLRRVKIDGKTLAVRELSLPARGKYNRVVWYWYQIGSSATASDSKAKIIEALNIAMLKPATSEVVIVSASGNQSIEQLRGIFEQFVEEFEVAAQ